MLVKLMCLNGCVSHADMSDWCYSYWFVKVSVLVMLICQGGRVCRADVSGCVS